MSATLLADNPQKPQPKTHNQRPITHNKKNNNPQPSADAQRTRAEGEAAKATNQGPTTAKTSKKLKPKTHNPKNEYLLYRSHAG